MPKVQDMGDHEPLRPGLDALGVSFVLHRGATSTAPGLGRFPPGAGQTGPSILQSPQQH